MKKNKKIILVTPYYQPSVGGVQNYVKNISEGLRNKYKWRIVVITTSDNGNKYKEELINGIKIYKLPYWFKISNTPINPFWYFQIKKIINEEKPDIVNAHTPVPFISDVAVRVCKKIPFILTYHNDLIKENMILNYICKFYYFALGNRTLEKSNRIIATSEFYVKNSPYLKKHLDKINIVSPGVDANRFNLKVDKNFLKKRYGKRPITLFVGQLDKTHIHKGIYYLLDSMILVESKIKNSLLIIVGAGDNIENYKKYLKTKAIEKNVIFKEFVSDEELPKYYSGANVTVLPTYDNSEGFGMVLIEAGACGKPVIGTRVGGIPYVISDNKTGIIVPPKDSRALADAIIKILIKSKMSQELGKRGYFKVKNNFTNEIQINKTKLIYNQMFI